jgi:hypothetical protein
VGPVVQTRAFEDAADAVRAQAVRAAERLERLGVWDAVALGESQRFHVRGVLQLYHYVEPKVLVLASAVRMALAGDEVGRGQPPASVERLEQGEPAGMMPMEWVSERPDDPRLRSLFKDILQRLGPPSLPGEYRALALWPEYLEAAWRRLKPLMETGEYRSACEALLATSRRQARELPYRVVLTRDQVDALEERTGVIVRVTEQMEERLPSLVMNVALMVLDTPEVEQLVPFPAQAWREPAYAPVGDLQ